jgi:hypothetical protein
VGRSVVVRSGGDRGRDVAGLNIAEGAPLADDDFMLTLWAWAAEIDLEPYVDGLEVATMAERWQDSRRLKQMPTVAHGVLVAEQEFRGRRAAAGGRGTQMTPDRSSTSKCAERSSPGERPAVAAGWHRPTAA